MKTIQAEEALRLVREAIEPSRTAGDLPEFFAELERLRIAVLLAPRVQPSAPEPEKPDRLLTTAQLAGRTGLSPWWIRQNKDTLPIVRLQTGRYRFSEKGVEAWIARRRA